MWNSLCKDLEARRNTQEEEGGRGMCLEVEDMLGSVMAGTEASASSSWPTASQGAGNGNVHLQNHTPPNRCLTPHCPSSLLLLLHGGDS